MRQYSSDDMRASLEKNGMNKVLATTTYSSPLLADRGKTLSFTKTVSNEGKEA